MPIPVYSPISDAEIAPGQDPTASVFVRLRDNPLSILGIDPANPNPVVNPPSQMIYDSHEIDVPTLTWPSFTVPADIYGPWLEIANEDSIGALDFYAFQLSVSLWRTETSARCNMTLTWGDLQLPYVPNQSGAKVYMTAVSALYSGNAFAGVRIRNSNEATYEPNGFPFDPGMIASGDLHNGHTLDLPPNGTAMLLRLSAPSPSTGQATLYVEHQTVGGSQQIRFHGVTVLPFARAGAGAIHRILRYRYAING